MTPTRPELLSLAASLVEMAASLRDGEMELMTLEEGRVVLRTEDKKYFNRPEIRSLPIFVDLPRQGRMLVKKPFYEWIKSLRLEG